MEKQQEPLVRVKHEPPVEFVLILPRPTIGWPAIKKEEIEAKWWVKSVKLTKFDARWHGESKQFHTFVICPHCQLVVKTQVHLTLHLRACIKIRQARFECDICGERFQQKSSLRQHMLKHSSEEKFRCFKCGFGFKTKHRLLNHSRLKTIHKCAVCDFKFSCKLLLNRHRSEFHGNLFKCDKCSYQTRIKSRFMLHKRTHDKPIACETCQKSFATNHSLKLHQMQHRHGIYATAPEETFDCDKCEKSYSSVVYLKQHQRNFHDENEVKCEVCDKICRNRNLMLNHRRRHIKVECSICHRMIPKNFASLHLRMHSADNIFECDLCEYSGKAKGILKKHIERQHLLRMLLDDSKCRGDFCDFELLAKLQRKYESSATSSEKKFKCEQCGKAFLTPMTLNRHKQIFHVDKLLECQICKKKVHQYQLKSHMKFHSPGNHFECDLCDYKSETKQQLKTHVKGRHRNGALICPLGCRQKFASFDQILEHRKIHIGKKQWKCMKCEYQTTGHQELLKHMATKKHRIAS